MGNLEEIYNDLQLISDRLAKEIEDSGAGERYRTIYNQIKEVGWDKLLQFIHPEFNYKDPAAKELFEFYKFVHEDMKKKGAI